ncbi:hypothetical protein CJJ09_003715 [Candidozyma auris]|nr:hypothetical protein CJJ09_003715 [[Candida] auris]
MDPSRAHKSSVPAASSHPSSPPIPKSRFFGSSWSDSAFHHLNHPHIFQHEVRTPLAKPRQYPYTLEVLESQANRKLLNEYKGDNKQWLAVLEQSSAPNPQMIDLQPEVQWYMRPYLLDFLIELHQSFRLQPATLFLCINIIDRYCAKRIVFKRHYQLVGCTALWIAGKYEDKKSRVPTLRELAIMCRHAYDEEMFVQMEMHIWPRWVADFHPSLEECLHLAIAESGVVGAHSTPCKYNRPKQGHVSDSLSSKVSAVTAVGRFFCELALYDRYFLTVPASLVAITANLLACSMLGVSAAASTCAPCSLNSVSDSSAGHCEEETGPAGGRRLLAGARQDLAQPGAQDRLDASTDHVAGGATAEHSLLVKAVIDHSATILADDPSALASSEVARVADALLSIGHDDLKPPSVFGCAGAGTNPTAAASTTTLPLTPPSASQSSVFSHHASSSAQTTPILYGTSGQFVSAYSPMPSSDPAWSSPLVPRAIEAISPPTLSGHNSIGNYNVDADFRRKRSRNGCEKQSRRDVHLNRECGALG